MGVIATETFTASNNSSLPAAIANWSFPTGVSGIGVNTNAYYPSVNNAEGCAYWNPDTPPNDQYAQSVYTATSTQGNIGVSCRIATGAASYYGYYGSTNHSEFFKVVGGTWTQFGSNLGALASNDVIRIEAVGTTIRALVNGTQQASTTDSSHSSGRFGVAAWSSNSPTGQRMDNWEGGDFAAPETGRPYGGRGARQMAQLLAQ